MADYSSNRISNKPEEYKVCKKCKSINYWQNRMCDSCEGFYFRPEGIGVLEALKSIPIIGIEDTSEMVSEV